MRTIGTVSFLASMGYVPTEFMESWYQMVQFNEQFMTSETGEIYYLRAKGSMHSTMRNWLAENFMGDWLIQVDADHVFEADSAYRLIRHMLEYDAPVISGLYFRKKYPFLPEAHIFHKKTKMMAPCTAWDQDVIKVDAVGAGFLAVRRDVFDQIKIDLGEQPFSLKGNYSEDFSFGVRCRALGIPTLLDTTIQVGHLMSQIIDADNFMETGIHPGRVDDITEVEVYKQDEEDDDSKAY